MSNLFALSYSNKKKNLNHPFVRRGEAYFCDEKKENCRKWSEVFVLRVLKIGRKGFEKVVHGEKKNTGIRTHKKKEKGDTKRSTSRWSELPYRWYPMIMFHCCTMPSSLETDIAAKHSPRSGQTDERTRLSNPNSCRINLCIERWKDSLLKFYKYNFVEL